VQHVALDANVFVSYFTARNARQLAAARTLLQQAEEGERVAIVPQFVVFEVTYVMQSQYAVTGERLATMIRDVVTFPGVQVIDQCPWKRVMEVWPNPFPSIADAALVAVATTNRYEAVATFDQKLAKRLEDFGIAAYW
jgi:predicted nucleic acid-binding protein